jgi:hypothetical protein
MATLPVSRWLLRHCNAVLLICINRDGDFGVVENIVNQRSSSHGGLIKSLNLKAGGQHSTLLIGTRKPRSKDYKSIL